jgi:hypothetical protein
MAFPRSVELDFQSILEIQCQIGKPITMPIANVAIKQSASVSFLILSFLTLGLRRVAKILATALPALLVRLAAW